MLEGQCWGSVKAVWGCVDGHRYIMDTRYTPPTCLSRAESLKGGDLGRGICDGELSGEDEEQDDEEEKQPPGNGRTSLEDVSSQHQSGLPAAAVQTQNSAPDEWTGSSEGETCISESPPAALNAPWSGMQGAVV